MSDHQVATSTLACAWVNASISGIPVPVPRTIHSNSTARSPSAFGCASRNRSRCDQPSRCRYFSAW